MIFLRLSSPVPISTPRIDERHTGHLMESAIQEPTQTTHWLMQAKEEVREV
jgi:hypothetical protein